MATIPKKPVTRRIPKANVEPAPAAKVTPIKALTKAKATSVVKPLYTIDVGNYDEKSTYLEGVASTIYGHSRFAFPDDGENITIHIISPNNKNFEFLLSGFPNCCGVCVMGGFTLDRDFPAQDLTTILDDLVSHPDTKGKTMQITTAQRATCLRMAEALSKCKYWTAVKTFKNKNSGNEVTIWVSNNE